MRFSPIAKHKGQRLDLGCGIRKKDDCIAVDKLSTRATDVVTDVERGLPFKSDSFEYIWINHVLEHVSDLVQVMEEVWRVSVPEAIVEVRGPHFSSPNVVWGDPTHRRALSLAMFSCFLPARDWYYTDARFQIVRCQLKRNLGDGRPQAEHWWDHVRRLLDWALERLANRSLLWVQRAERYAGGMFRFNEIQLTLKVAKNSHTSTSPERRIR